MTRLSPRLAAIAIGLLLPLAPAGAGAQEPAIPPSEPATLSAPPAGVGTELGSPEQADPELAPAPGAAVPGAPTGGPSAADAAVEPIGAAAQGLPARPQPPRTLRDHWHVFVAFAIVLGLILGYVVVLARRFARLDREVAALRSEVGRG